MLSLPLNGHQLYAKIQKLALLALALFLYQPAAAQTGPFLFDSLVFARIFFDSRDFLS